MEFIPPTIELVPKIKGFWCKLAMYALYTALSIVPMILGLYIGYMYDIWLGVIAFLFLTLVSGVVSSKMRICSIPPAQREMSYTTMAIVKWYLAKNICLKNEDVGL